MPRRPIKMKDREKAPEIVALVHPSSVAIGLRKTPKEWNVPHIVAMMRKATATAA